jgi:membrane-associated protein
MSFLSDFGDQLVAWMLSYGYMILMLVLLLGALGLPMPAGLIATVAGTLVADGDLDPVLTLLIALVACMLGDLAGYAIGRRGGRELAGRHGRWLGMGAARLAQAEVLFEHWAAPTLLLSRSLVAIVGPAVNLLAGASGLRVSTFLVYDLAGRLLWVAAYVGLGYAFAGRVDTAADLASGLGGLLGVVGLALALGLPRVSAATSWVKRLDSERKLG